MKNTRTAAPSTSVAPAGVELRPKLTSVRVSSEDLVHYVNNFGRHDAYAGGEQVRARVRVNAFASTLLDQRTKD